MDIHLTGEDGCTFYALWNKSYREQILEDCGIRTLEELWFRPSFGRGAGAAGDKHERQYSGFGEPDALLIGKGEAGEPVVVFLESKRNRVDRGKANYNQLRYQFFLKYALIWSILNTQKGKKRGKCNTVGDYHCVEPDQNIGLVLSDLYREYKTGKSGSKDRGNIGWLLRENTDDAPALMPIYTLLNHGLQQVRFRFYALGFVKNEKDEGQGADLAFFKDLNFDFGQTPGSLFCEALENTPGVRWRNMFLEDVNDEDPRDQGIRLRIRGSYGMSRASVDSPPH